MTTSHDNGIQHRRQEVQQAVRNACDQLNADGVAPRDYVEQLAWLFFLKAFDEAENQREEEAAFGDEVYRRRLNGEYRWASWANRTDRPDEMLRFVDGELWLHLRNFGIAEGNRRVRRGPGGRAASPNLLVGSQPLAARRELRPRGAAGRPAALLGPNGCHRPVRDL